jgi:hypothetical protein
MGTTHRVTHTDQSLSKNHPPPTNGSAAKHGNGHGQASAARPQAGDEAATPDRARAASDDAHEASSGASAKAAIPPAASAERVACAEVARASNGDSAKEPAAKNARKSRARRGSRRKTLGDAASDEASETATPLPPALRLLPADAIKFTEELHAQADFLEVGKRLLNSTDERIVKGVWEHMLELRYGKEAPPDENARRIVIDMPRPLHGQLPTQ